MCHGRHFIFQKVDDGGLLNLWRLQAKTKTSSTAISALRYSDDAVFPSLTADGLQFIQVPKDLHVNTDVEIAMKCSMSNLVRK